MILTGPQLLREVRAGRVVIDPFDEALVEPNSYGFHLGDELVVYEDDVLDTGRRPRASERRIADAGIVLEPGALYLGRTREVMGSDHYAATLYACRSVSTLGMWIQVSAPLGHTGAIIPWTLEIIVTAQTVVYPGMRIGKIAFWTPLGSISGYEGRYLDSTSTVPSLLAPAQRVPLEVA